MSDMPARLLSEAQRPTHVGEEDVRVASKKGVRSPSPYDKSESRKGKSRSEKDSNVESAEEDELSDGSASPSSSTLPRLGARRSGSLKRKSSKSESLTQTSKRSRPLRDSAAASTQAGPSSSRVPSTLQEDVEEPAQDDVKPVASPDRSSRNSSASRRESLSSESASNSVSGQPGAVLTSEEVNEFLTLIYKHHPEPMTAQNMKKSVDALHHDWQTYCNGRQIPVMAKKPLMDEYGKIFNGVYGSRLQKRARAIAQELSQRSLSSGNSEELQRESRTSRGGASDLGSEAEDSDVSGDETADRPKDETVDNSQDPVNPAASTSTNPKKSNIARVGRNGLAVLPPGLFDILRTHLRDDILSGIMPMVRSDLSEQTRELFLQNQDLFNRIRDMEEQIRNQDLWIRHLLARESEWPPHHGPVGPAGNVVPNPLSRSFGAASKDSSNSRTSRYGPPSESDYLPPHTGQSGGDGVSPRQQRFEKRPSHQQGPAGPVMWDARSAGAPPSGRWDGFAHVVQDRRASYAVDLSHRKDSWAEDMGPRGFRSKADRPEFAEPRFDALQHRRGSRPAGSAAGVVGPAGAQPFPGHAQQQSQLGRPISPQDDFRRPMQPTHPSMLGEGGSPPGSGPMYDMRRPYPGFVTTAPESHFGAGVDPASSTMLPGQTARSPLPPRSALTTPDAALAKNKRGRPTNAETSIRTNT